MAVFYSTDNLPAFKNPVLTIGTFDGVHKGHQAILKDVVQQAKTIGGESILVTFEPHPRKLIYPDQSLQLLTTLDEKIKLILSTGIQHIVVTPFDSAFASLTAEEYIRDFLVGKFAPKQVVIGYDHRFGHDRKGDLTLMSALSDAYGYTVSEIPAQKIDAAAVSSTKIRKALQSGDVAGATAMLGRPYTLTGTVISGAQVGRTLGFPTANVQPLSADQLVPANGVYAIRVQEGDRVHHAMLNIGIRPTVDTSLQLHIEAHIFDFDADLYGRELTLSFAARLRDEQKFPSLEALRAQLARDAAASRAMLR